MIYHFDSEPHVRKAVQKRTLQIYFVIVSILLTSLITFAWRYMKPRLVLLAQAKTLSPISSAYTPPVSAGKKTFHPSKTVIGFLPSWSIAAHAKIYPEYLDQIIYFGIGINRDGQLMRYDQDHSELIEWQYLNGSEFKAIRARSAATSTKILVSIKNFDNASIDRIISTPTITQTAITQIVDLVIKQKLDGININFEYFSDTDFPTMRYLNTFLTQLRTQLKKVKPDAIISFDINATAAYQDNAYDMVKIGQEVDQVILMGYDYSRPVSANAGAVSPLYENGGKPSVSLSVMSMLGRVPKEKIVLGIPFYGYEWQTYTSAAGSRTVPDTGALATYKRIRELLASRDDVTFFYDEITHTPRLVYKQNGLIKQIYYEDERSLTEKIEYVYDTDLSGIAIWALGYEGDFIAPWQVIKENLRH